MSSKARITATVDSEILDAARRAVASGQAESVSAWMNDALHDKAEHDDRLAAIDAMLRAYEAEHGEITEAEIQDAKQRAAVIRGSFPASR
jgi:hypothetical protein